MTTETRQRIRAYKRMLPDLRERVIAVALLLAMSASMLGSASFAWITLSRAPEISGMSTTVAANGNLEIALAQGSTSDPLAAPLESKTGDSSAAEGQTIVGSNVTWGNLVNVSDPVYGISEIALRPALLSDFNRTEYPLNGATYGGDGRVVSTNDRYEYASYEKLAGSTNYYFAAGADAAGRSLVNYGVRAITSVGYVNLSGNDRVTRYNVDTRSLYQAAQTYYGLIVSNETNDVNTLNAQKKVTCISALEGLVTVFAQNRIYQMLLRLEKVLADEGIALLELVNWQAYVKSGDDKIENKVPSVDALLAMKASQLRDESLGLSENTVKTILSYQQDVADLRLCIKGGTKGGKTYNSIEDMAGKCSNPDAPTVDYYWDSIANNVNLLVDINTATLAGVKLSQVGISSVGKIINGGDVIVYKGLLKNVEARLVDQDHRVKANVKVTVTDVPLYGTKTIPGVVYTDVGKAGTTPTYAAAFEDATRLVSVAKGEATAKNTYGMALDVWLRTNYPNAVLTLEGAAKYTEEPANITLKVDGQETTYRLHTITVSDSPVDVYKKDDTWYYASTHSEVPAEDLGDQPPKEKFNKIVSGYEGENRVWEDWRDMLDGGYIEQDATTQGAGSCFVFYADNPVQQEKIKEMLQAFNVAFINQKGDTLGTAKLNLETAYANQGKVTVPLEMSAGTEYIDENGKSHTGITTLTQNEPLFVTAIIYLNGAELQNENVLANGELQGQLNIQFGTSATLVAPKNEELAAKARTITATVTANGESITNGTIGGTEGLEYNPNGYPTTVTLNVEGEQPEKISGYFIRVINESQGTRGEEIQFTPNGDGTWTGAFTKDENGEWTVPLKLTNPGTYAFDTLIVDGAQYTLHDGTVKKTQDEYYPANRPKVYIKGLALESVSIKETPRTYMTTDTSIDLEVTAVVDAAVEPKRVTAQFFSEDKKKQYTAILTRVGETNSWTGAATIASSGVYTLDFIGVDDQTLPAPSTGQYTMFLGLTANVSTPLPKANWEFFYTGATQIDMEVRIYDDGGQPIEDLSGVQLFYHNVDSPAGLTWENGCYEGAFDILRPGEMTFSKIELGDVGTIRNVNSDAPRFLAINLNTPSYLNGQATNIQTKIYEGETPTMQVNLKDAGTAQNVYAEIVHTLKGKETKMNIPAKETSGESRTFNLPRQDGVYRLKRVFLQGVYDKEWTNAAGEKEGKWYANTNTAPTSNTESTFFILQATDNPTTKVIASYNIDLYYDENGNGVFENDADYSELKTRDFTIHLTGNPDDEDNPPTGTLFQGYRHNNLQIVVTDYEGNAITGVSGTGKELENSLTKMTLAYTEGSSVKYGNYTGANGAVSPADIDVGLVLDADGKRLTLVDADPAVEGIQGTKLIHSGEYTATIKVEMQGRDVTVPVKPIFTVATKSPTVKVKSISPAPGTTYRYYGVSQPNSIGQLVEGDFFRYSDYNASVYLYTKKSGGGRDNEAAHAYAPTVDLELSNVSKGYTDAAMTFTAVKAGSVNSTFSFGSGTTATSSIGQVTDGRESLLGGPETFPKLYPAGKMIQDKLSLKYSGVEYEITLANVITIDQPQSPTVLKFTGLPDTYTGFKQVNGIGSTIATKLPAVEWTATIEEPVDGTWSAYTSVGEFDNDNDGVPDGRVYGYQYYSETYKVGCAYVTNHHRACQYYNWTKFQSSCTAVTNVYTQRKQITHWIIDGETYEAGETINISAEGMITATPVIANIGEQELIDTKDQTSYRYLYGYVQGDSDSESSLSGFNDSYVGTQIGSTAGSSGTLPSAKVADASKANAATNTPGTNMTTDSEAYEQYWP